MKILLLAIQFLFSVACLGKMPEDSLHEKLFSVKELQQDMDSLQWILKHNHPDLWRHADSATTEREWMAARYRITQPMKRWDFIKIVSPLLSQYKDGHTSLSYFEFDYPEVEELVKRDGRIFPWQLYFHHDTAWVVADLHNKEHAIGGAYIQSINGIAMRNIIRSLTPLMAGDYKENIEACLSRLFSFFAWAYYGWEDKFHISIVNNRGNKQALQSTGIAMSTYLDIQFPKKDWSMQVAETNSLAIIECRNYRNRKAAVDFIDSAFAVIKEKNIQHVAFDIRRNGGGNSSIGDYLLSYITDKNYTDAVSKTIRDGSMIRKFKEGSWVNKMLLRYKTTGKKEGDLYTLDFGLREPDSINFPSNKFKGKFYLLTGPATYSSAHMTAMAVKCYQLGTVIGQPTGEQNDLTGESFGYQLPNTGLSAYCATAIYLAVCGDKKQQGVQPHLLVPFNAKDFADNTDSTIEFLKNLVNKN